MWLLFFLLLLLFGYQIGQLFGYLLMALWDALHFLGIALGAALLALARATGILLVAAVRLAGRGIVHAGRGIGIALTFLYFLADEALRGAPHEEADEAEEPDEEDLVDAALTLLGLPADYTRAALGAAFKQAMKKAHPDAGGSESEAQAVNAARDLLMRRRGWA